MQLPMIFFRAYLWSWKPELQCRLLRQGEDLEPESVKAIPRALDVYLDGKELPV